MKVWRCLAHDSDAPHRDARCWYAVAKLIDRSGFDPGPCRMVEMQLVPADARVVSGEALVIEKENGEWPDWALTPLRGAFLGVPILDALASAQIGGEPPKDPWDYDP